MYLKKIRFFFNLITIYFLLAFATPNFTPAANPTQPPTRETGTIFPK